MYIFWVTRKQQFQPSDTNIPKLLTSSFHSSNYTQTQSLTYYLPTNIPTNILSHLSTPHHAYSLSLLALLYIHNPCYHQHYLNSPHHIKILHFYATTDYAVYSSPKFVPIPHPQTYFSKAIIYHLP